jgi:TRAP-type C4-dicarboxylate transport system permease small subunit
MHSGPFKVLAPVARIVAIMCGWGLMGVSVLTCIEIIGRRFFSFSFQGIDEVSGYAMAVVSAAGFTYALGTRAHMRITLLFPYLPPVARSVLNVVALLTLAAMAVFCAVRGFAEVQASIGVEKGDWWDPAIWRRANTPMQTPLWIPQALWFAGLALFATAATACAVHAIGLLFRDRYQLDRLYGPQTLDEEIKVETELAEQRLSEHPPKQEQPA